jgi:hypothetical protein
VFEEVLEPSVAATTPKLSADGYRKQAEQCGCSLWMSKLL